MRCEQARQLFDGYLNGELSPSLTTELGAHRLRCPECRRALALLEVSGHIVASDYEPTELRGDFTDRLMACMESPRGGWLARYRRRLYFAGPLAAAAVVALAFVGVFDRPQGVRLGNKNVTSSYSDDSASSADELQQLLDGVAGDAQLPAPTRPSERDLEAWVADMQKNMTAKQESLESLRKPFKLTIEQLLDILREADQPSEDYREPAAPDETVPVEPSDAKSAGDENIEDL